MINPQAIALKAKAYIYRLLQTLLRYTWRADGGRRITAFGGEITIAPETVFPSYRRLRLPRGSAKSEIVRYGDFVQLHSAMAYLDSLRRPVTVVDVGAHHGAYAVLLGKVVQKMGGRVIAVEPNASCFDVLERNVRQNNLEGAVFCEHCAVLDKPGMVAISLDGSESRVSGTASSGAVAVEAVTLEMLIQKYHITAIDLLIVDVEGAELPVLRGFPWGKLEIGKIFCELHPYAWAGFGYSGQDMQTFLQEHDLRCIDMYLMEYTTFPDFGYVGPAVLFPQGGNKLSPRPGANDG
jgi:FkbM family methyltransferase